MGDIEFGKPLAVTMTPIPGLVVFDLPVHGDSRGWFKENWQRAKMVEAGLPAPSIVRPAKIATIEAKDAEAAGRLPLADRQVIAGFLLAALREASGVPG